MFMVVKTKPTIKSRIPVKNKAKTTVKLKEKSRPAAGSKKSVTSGKEDFARLAEDIISNVGVGIYVLQQGKFVYVSSLYKKLSGYLDKELIGLKSLDYIHPEDREITRQNAIKALKRERSEPYEYRFIKKNGEIMWALEMVASVKYRGKRAVLGSFMDITERKIMEESLHKSEEKYRSILENIEEGYAELDLKGNLVFFNDALCRIHGYTREETMKMKNYRTIMDDDNAKKMFYYYNKAYSTGQSLKEVEYEIIAKGGQRRYLETSITPIKDPKGKIRAFRGILTDRTERKKTEEALRQSEQRYRTILEEMDEAYFEVDLAGNYTYVNDAICRLLGYPQEELLGTTFRKQVNEEDTALLYDAFGKIFATGKPVRDIAYKAIRKGGEIRYSEITGFPIQNQKGEVIGFRGIGRDVTERKRMEEALRQSEQRYRTILEEMDEAYFEVDLAGNYTYVNDAISRLLGYPKEELIGTTFRKQVNEEYTALIYDAFGRIFTTGQPVRDIAYKAIRKGGEIIYAEINGFPIQNQKGEVIGFRGIGRDVTERKRMEEALRQSEQRYRTILEEMDEAYFEVDLAGNYTYVNDAISRLLGYPKEELLGTTFRKQVNEEDTALLYDAFGRIFTTGKPVRDIAYKAIRKGGEVRYSEIAGFPIQNQKAEVIGFRGIGRDVTERKRTEEQIRHMATHDALTELPNRMMFNQLLNHAIQAAKRNKRKLAVLFIDLDRFKIINDTLGHEAGDELLKTIATRFRQSLRAMDVVARLGGDEFVILVEEVDNPGQLVTVAQKILSAAMKPVSLMGEECRVTASVGISMYPKDGEDEQALMKTADKAMYFAKEEGKNNYQFYSESMKSQSIEQLSLETHLRLALERKELSLNYQAKLDFKTGAITGVEALLRWHSPILGDVTPTQFIPVAEETGLIIPIGRWVIRTACEQNVAWQQRGLPPVCISVNLSLRQLRDENLIEDIKAVLGDSGMAPHLLELEITESMVMHNPVRMVEILTKIKDMGVRLAIDDFGTGYSSLAHIKRFPIDTIKVDRSFIRNVPEDYEDKAIIEAIISMGQTLSLTVVAEGVETQEQMNYLKEHSCHEMQGYYFSKPVSADEFASLLKTNLFTPRT
jgi:diguanylate cyclase (GGDEF)-like protein/PAS domain S-box-containing protein